ncbi:MAG: alkaline phosphatase family protein [Ilumatobacteraceae bacterium]
MLEPRIPNYSGACTANIIPALLGPSSPDVMPDWMPRAARGARQVVVLVLDGLGWHQLVARHEIAPVLCSGEGTSITTVAPTTTGTALTSITTGLTPGEHGLMGYRMDMGRRVVQMLRWADEKGDVRSSFDPSVVQPTPPFLGSSVPILSKAELEGTAFTEAHLRGGKPMGWRVPSSLPVQIGTLLEQGARFVYAYYDGIDKVAHERGFGDYYDAELVHVDALVSRIIDRLVPDSALVITADHGQVHVGGNTVRLDDRLQRHVEYLSGEGRFRWLHVRRGTESEVRAIAEDLYGGRAWVLTRDDMIDAGWFGPRVTDVARKRLGDVALVPFSKVSFDDPADHGSFPLVCRHGSMTDDEIDVPLLAWRAN